MSSDIDALTDLAEALRDHKRRWDHIEDEALWRGYEMARTIVARHLAAARIKKGAPHDDRPRP